MRLQNVRLTHFKRTSVPAILIEDSFLIFRFLEKNNPENYFQLEYHNFFLYREKLAKRTCICR